MLKALDYQYITSFCGRYFFGRKAAGNRHQIVRLDHFSESAAACQHSLSITPLIYVETCRGYDGVVHLRYYHRGHEVQNCGSGTLAAAAYWRQHANTVSLPYKNRVSSGRFLQRGPLSGYTQQGLACFRPKPRAQAYWRALCGQPVKTVTEVIGQRYVIVELSTAAMVKKMCPRLGRLRKLPLALIVTARNNTAKLNTSKHSTSKHNKAGVDYVMRYFAPHYGNDEDAATGSANCLLIQYWRAELGNKGLCNDSLGNKVLGTRAVLHGFQLSRCGGEFYGCVGDGEVQAYGGVLIFS